MTVIDLGELHGDELPQPADQIPRRVLQRIGLVGVFALCLAVLAASVPHAEPPVAVTVPAGPNARAVVQDNLLFVVDGWAGWRGPGGTGEPMLAAYALPDARLLWRIPLPAGELHSVVYLGDVVLVGGGLFRAESETVAVSAAGGTIRWRRPGNLHAITSSSNVLVRTGPSDGDGMLHSVDTRTGADRWARPLATREVSFRWQDRATDLMVLETARGLELRDPESGDLLRTLVVPPSEAHQPGHILFVGDLLLVSDNQMITAYDATSLSQKWSRSLDPSQELLIRCGESACLQTYAGALDNPGAVQVLDLATGRTRWSNDRLLIVRAVGDRWLVAQSGSVAGASELTIVDGDSGRIRRHLGTWWPSWRGSGEGPVAGQRLADGRLLVARFDLASDSVQVIEVLPKMVDDCQMSDSALVCRQEDGAVGVWRIDRAPR